MDDILCNSATTLAHAIRSKKVSSREMVEAHLGRIEEVNPKLNAVVQLAAARALSEAERADSALARGEILGVLHGVPITLKDSIDTEGIVTTGGTEGRSGYIPATDATVAARLRAQGAVLMGKTNTPELTLAGETDNLVYGRTNNPYDLSRSPGGSSGGAAAIIASCGSPLDIGSDTGGSIRAPSHFCGIAGIKPTSGRVPRTGHIVPYGMGAVDALTQLGPMARYVEDLALVLSIIAGADDRDPGIIPMPSMGGPGCIDMAGLRVAVHTNNGVMEPTRETVRTVENAAVALKDAGVAIESKCPKAIAENADLPSDLMSADGRAWTRRLLEKAGTKEVHPWLVKRLDDANTVSAARLTEILEKLDAYRSDMLGFMQDYDAILCPACVFPALPHGASLADDKAKGFSYTNAYNLTGWPGAVVRAGVSDEGMPIGIQIVAKPWREDVALALCGSIEASLGGWQSPNL
jgi:amidase